MPHLDVGSLCVIHRVVYLIISLCRGDLGNIRPCAFLFFAVHLANGGNSKTKVGIGFQVLELIGCRIGREQFGNFRILAVFYTVHIVAICLRPSGGLIRLRPGKAYRIICKQVCLQIIYCRSRCADI